MARFDQMKGVFGLLPTPYSEDFEIHIDDLRAVANFCCESGQHGIVWPVMVGEFYFLGEEERVRGLDAVLEEVNGRLPVVFGCSGVSIPQVLGFARAAQSASADAIIAMAPDRCDQAGAIEMFRRLAEVYDGPIMVQNADRYAPLRGEQIAALVEEIPQIEYIKEERQPGPKHIAEVAQLVGDKVKCIFGGAAGKFLPDESRKGKAAELLGVDIRDTVAIEDSPNGVRSAAAAGCTVIGVPNLVSLAGTGTSVILETLAGVGVSDVARMHAERGLHAGHVA